MHACYDMVLEWHSISYALLYYILCYNTLCYAMLYVMLCYSVHYTMMSLFLGCLFSNSMKPSLGALLGLRCYAFGISSEVQRRLRTGSIQELIYASFPCDSQSYHSLWLLVGGELYSGASIGECYLSFLIRCQLLKLNLKSSTVFSRAGFTMPDKISMRQTESLVGKGKLREKQLLFLPYCQYKGFCACSVAHSCLTLCDPMDCSPPVFSVHGIFQARILEWVAILYFRKLHPKYEAIPDPGVEAVYLVTPALEGRFFIPGLPGKPIGDYA